MLRAVRTEASKQFSKQSSALVNVVWVWANFIVAAVFLHFAHVRTHEYKAFVLVALAGLLIVLFDAAVWSSLENTNKKIVKLPF